MLCSKDRKKKLMEIFEKSRTAIFWILIFFSMCGK
jgi:hypothetical protein